MLRQALEAVVALYLLPLRVSERLLYYAKCQGLLTGAEHLYWATRYILRHGGAGEGATVIDVGAFDGRTALYLKNRLPTATVYCLEPHPDRAAALARFLTGRGFVVRQLAMSDRTGEALLHVPSDERAASLLETDPVELDRAVQSVGATLAPRKAITVPVSTLDAEFADIGDVLLIKIDTQGTEVEVLGGATALLDRTRFVLTEMNAHSLYRNTCQYFEVDTLLRKHGFRLIDITVSYHGDDGLREFDALYERNPTGTE